MIRHECITFGVHRHKKSQEIFHNIRLILSVIEKLGRMYGSGLFELWILIFYWGKKRTGVYFDVAILVFFNDDLSEVLINKVCIG